MTRKAIQYHSETIDAFKDNPLIEALPARITTAEVIRRLTYRPPFSEKDRMASTEDRGMMVQTLLRIYQPCEKDIDIYTKIERCIRWGYADRNPLSAEFIRQQRYEYEAYLMGKDFIRYTQSYPTTSGFALLGISGLGKSTTLHHVLGHYPQVIRHTSYKGSPFNETQVTWIHMDCPNDGSLKGLCGAFFEHIDSLLGTDYFGQYDERRSTLNKMRIAMARIARTYHLGVIVIDEIQSLCVAKDASIPVKTLNFLVTLVNTIGVPVILVGTPRALSFLQKEFQQAKRASGQGDALWEHMQNDDVWRMFVKAIWKYQYTRQRVSLTNEMYDALYDEAVGIPFLAVNIYKLVQEHAIYSGEETFSSNAFHDIASRKMKLTLEMRRALRSGKDINLEQYLDLTPFKSSDFMNTITHDINPPEPTPRKPVRKPEINELAIQALLAFGIDRPSASRHVGQVLAKNPSHTQASIVAREAYSDYLQLLASKKPATDPSDHLPALTDSYDSNLALGVIGL